LVPYHTHEEEETLIVLDGRMQFNVEEELVLLQKGEMITIREGAIHAAASIDGKPAKILIAFGGDRDGTVDEEYLDTEEDEDFGSTL
jgi:quercetin dioxygenase-like cupin family protein